MQTRIVSSMDEFPRAQWNALLPDNNPFIRHEFLAALEHGDCLRPYGWVPQHLGVWSDERLVAAMPMYLKNNTYGEFVFDFSWAQAYERHGLRYFPKLVVSVPYSPATGTRLLVSDPIYIKTLLEAAQNHARQIDASSLHILFPTEPEMCQLEAQGTLRRAGCQFHWTNHDYRDFDDYLSTFTAEKRKKLRRERRHVQEAGVELEVVHGGEANDAQWEAYHRFYVSTFDRLGGMPTLSMQFFRELGAALPDQVVLVLAKHQGRYVAGAFCLRSDDTLYGRHWGCDAQFHSLHFEACYYQGIEYCIRHGLKRFEPGAQGEHKVGRGFVPTLTWSAHWLANPTFANAIGDFVRRERSAVDQYMQELNTHLPFNQDHAITINI